MMIAADLSNQIIGALTGVTQPGGINTLWDTICDYVENMCIVYYTWAGFTTTPPPTPDPMNITGIMARVNTSLGRTLELPGIDQATSAEEAMTILTTAMNTSAVRWMVKFPDGFMVSPCNIIPSIVVTPSGATSQSDAMLSLCTDVINGIMAATPAMGGSHGAYFGAGAFSMMM